MTVRPLCIVIGLIALAHAPFAHAQVLVWGDNNTNDVRLGNADGSGTGRVLYDLSDGLGTVQFLAFDPATNDIYLSDLTNQSMYRASVTGYAPPVQLFGPADGLDSPEGIQVDIAGGKIYIADSGLSNRIFVGNLDGSGTLTELFNSADGVTTPWGLDLDVDNGKIYWARDDASILVGNIDGSGTPAVLYDSSDGIVYLNHFAVDPANGYIYWADALGVKLIRANLDGSGGLLTLFDSGDGLTSVVGVTLDIPNGRIYFTDSLANQILVGNIDGSGSPTVLFDGPDSIGGGPQGIILRDFPSLPTRPWTSAIMVLLILALSSRYLARRRHTTGLETRRGAREAARGR